MDKRSWFLYEYGIDIVLEFRISTITHKNPDKTMQVIVFFKENFLLAIIIALFLCFSTLPAQAQTVKSNRNQFYSVVELTRLIQRAKEAGFSDDEIANLQIKDGDQVINVKEYIERIENKKIFKQQQLEAFKKKKFLTINDIYTELVKLEPDVLTRLREELVSER